MRLIYTEVIDPEHPTNFEFCNSRTPKLFPCLDSIHHGLSFDFPCPGGQFEIWTNPNLKKFFVLAMVPYPSLLEGSPYFDFIKWIFLCKLLKIMFLGMTHFDFVY